MMVDKLTARSCLTEQQRRLTRCLSSLACLLIVAFAINIMPVAAQNPTLASDVLSKMLDLIARRGNDRELPADIANRLGLSAAGKVWPSRQAGLMETPGNLLHGVYASRGSDKDLLLSLTIAKEKVDLYRIRRDGILVAAVTLNLPRQQMVEHDRAEMQKGLDAELVYWSRVKPLE